MNILFIMADQLRWDHLSCSGHPFLKTPHIDALAARGVRFSQAYVTSAVCGPSRMSYYTGRYAVSHGATWNRVPLPVGQRTLGDHLRGQNSHHDLWLIGKSHVVADRDGLQRLAAEGDCAMAALLACGGFREVDRYDGHHEPAEESGYGSWLRAQGYDSPRPWTDHVISAIDENGQVVSGWHMRNVHLPARVAERHSETAYTTDRAISFIRERAERPWVLHLSYVKPHWPYMAPAPYHSLFGPEQCLPAARNEGERVDAHPVVAAYRDHEESRSFARDEAVSRVRPAYQGLIRQLDDNIGRLFEAMETMGRMKDTLVIFCADHGDFLGDHWLGEKELFFDCVQRVPFIVSDPRPQADATRGGTDDRFVECVDVVPTVLDALGVPSPDSWVEGRSLMPLLRGEHPPWREFVFSELDYSFRAARRALGRSPDQCRAFSIRTRHHRYVHWMDLPEQLYDLDADPDQFEDLGRTVGTVGLRMQMRERLLNFLLQRKTRTSIDVASIETATDAHRRAGIFYGQW